MRVHVGFEFLLESGTPTPIVSLMISAVCTARCRSDDTTASTDPTDADLFGGPAKLDWDSLQTTGLPIPLGGIMARRALGEEAIRRVGDAIRRSVEHAFAHPDASAGYVRAHAQEMDDAVARQHIDLYVNQHSVDVGEQGERAIRELFDRAARAGIIPADHPAPFLEPVPA